MNLSDFEPLEHSVLEEASDVRPKRVQSGVGPLKYSLPDVTPFWGDCLFIRRTVSEPLERSCLCVTDNIDQDGGHLEVMSDVDPLDSSALITTLDGRPMAGITVLELLGHPQGQIVLCCSVISQAGVSGSGLFRIFWKPCEEGHVYAGVSTTPVEMLVDDDRPFFPRLKFPT